MGVVDVPPKGVLDLAEADHTTEVLDRLEAKLLTVGGIRLVRKPPDPNAEAVLERGELFDLPVKLRRGERSRCHENSAAIWGSDIDRYQLVTGYALSDDGQWRPHTWVLDGKRIIETTLKRNRYFGIILPPPEAAWFWLTNFVAHQHPGPMGLLFQAGAGDQESAA